MYNVVFDVKIHILKTIYTMKFVKKHILKLNVSSQKNILYCNDPKSTQLGTLRSIMLTDK